jgi:hypothetical protein
MAIDLSTQNKFPYYKAIFINTNATQISLPSQVSQVTFGSSSSALWVGQNGCTDGDPMPADKMFVPANNAFQVRIGRGNSRAQSIFVATQSGTATVYVTLEEI